MSTVFFFLVFANFLRALPQINLGNEIVEVSNSCVDTNRGGESMSHRIPFWLLVSRSSSHCRPCPISGLFLHVEVKGGAVHGMAAASDAMIARLQP